MINSVSFCIFAVNRTERELDDCIRAIQELKVPDYEISVAGFDRQTTPEITYLYRQEWQSGFFSLGEVYNEFCKRARKDFVVLIDAAVQPDASWYENLKSVEYYDIIASKLSDRKGGRMVDWSTGRGLNGLYLVLPLEYNEWSPRGFGSSALLTFKRAIWDEVEFPEERPGPLEPIEDAAFCIEAQRLGFRAGVVPECTAVFTRAGLIERQGSPLYYDESRKILANVNNLQRKAHRAFNKRNFRKARRLFRELLKSEPDNPQVVHKLGCCSLELNDPQTAMEYFSKAIELNPSLPSVMQSLAWTHFRMGNYDKSLSTFSELLKSGEVSNADVAQDIHRGIGWSLFRMNRLEDALASFSRALKIISDGEGNHTQCDAEKGVFLSRYYQDHPVTADRLNMSGLNYLFLKVSCSLKGIKYTPMDAGLAERENAKSGNLKEEVLK